MAPFHAICCYYIWGISKLFVLFYCKNKSCSRGNFSFSFPFFESNLSSSSLPMTVSSFSCRYCLFLSFLILSSCDSQIATLEARRKQILQGIVGVQKCFRRHLARHQFYELKSGVTTLQSCMLCLFVWFSNFTSNILLDAFSFTALQAKFCI